MCDSTETIILPDINQSIEAKTENVLPEKSKQLYVAVHNKFIDWQRANNTTSFSEDVLLTYFNNLARSYKPSSLWSHYSMLKSTLQTYNNIDIKSYTKLTAFLKKRNIGFKSQKSKALRPEDIEKFLTSAPENIYLATKVALIFGIQGACRRGEMTQINNEDVEDLNSIFLVKMPFTKTYVSRSFTITDKFYEIVKKYRSLRPLNCKCNRFFLNYRFGKCTMQPIGINKFGNMPKEIAKYLNLPNAELYTGHTFRRTSATLRAEASVDISALKRHSDWKSNQVAEQDIEQPLTDENNISKQIEDQVNTSTFIKTEMEELETEIPQDADQEKHVDISKTINIISTTNGSINEDIMSQINLPKNVHLSVNCTNLTINIYGKNE